MGHRPPDILRCQLKSGVGANIRKGEEQISRGALGISKRWSLALVKPESKITVEEGTSPERVP